MGTNRFKNLAYNSPLENRFKGLEEESQNIQPTPIQQAVQPQVSPMAPIKRTETISQAPPLAPPKEPSMWNKIARTVLPKGVEDLFGMNDDRPLTGKERVEKGEDMSQNYFRGQRKEENITGVTAPVEQYTAPTTTGGRWKEVIENKGYIKNVWSGFIKPAIGTVSEQVGIQLDNPKIRQWGEQFADRVMEEERRRASAQSMADVAGPTDGGLGDPRFYSKTITQGLGFMTAIFGTSLLVTATTKNPIAGAVAGYAVGTGLESSGAYQTMIDDGVSPEDASPAAGIYGAIATVIENATGIRPAGGVKTLVKDFSVDAARDGAIKNFMKKWAQEGILEEGSQQLVENFVAKFVDENRGLFDGVLDSMISGTVGALPMVGGGAVIGNYQNRNRKTPAPVNQNIIGEAQPRVPPIVPPIVPPGGGYQTSGETTPSGETTYRGASMAEWESIQQTGSFEKEEGSLLINPLTGKEIRSEGDVNRGTADTALGQKILNTGVEAPTIQTKRDIQVTTIQGEKVTIPSNEVLEAYESGGKALLKDGREYIVSKNQYENIKNQSVTSEAEDFAPELEGTKEKVLAENVYPKSAVWDRTSYNDTGALGGVRPAWKERTSGITIKQVNDRYDGMNVYKIYKPDGSEFIKGDHWKVLDEAKKRVQFEFDVQSSSIAGGTKYGRDTLVLPGGKEYKEILIKAPQPNDGLVFKSNHWSDTNVLFHLRYNLRKYKGKNVLFVEEMQSDWAREAREKGFEGETFKDYWDRNGYLPIEEYSTQEVDKMRDEWKDERHIAVPRNELLRQWQEMAVKRALQEAVKEKADYIVYINGDQTSQRYDLATHLNSVDWVKREDGKKLILLDTKKYGEVPILIDEKGTVIEYERGEATRLVRDMYGKRLDEVLGKGLADSIMKDDSGVLADEGLEFGGEWATNLYEKQLPNLTKKVTGGEIETIDMGLPVAGTEVGWSINTGTEEAKMVEEKDLKVGLVMTMYDMSDWKVLEVKKDGEFVARPLDIKYNPDTDNRITEQEARTVSSMSKETFYLTPKERNNQKAIKLTPAIQRKIKGEAPLFQGQREETDSDVQGVSPYPLGLNKAMEEAELNRPIGELQEEYRATQPGRKKFEKWLKVWMDNKVILPEDAVIMRTIVENFDDEALSKIDYGRIRSDSLTKAGGFKYGITHDAERKTDNRPDSQFDFDRKFELKLRTGLSKEAIASWVFAHEFSHLGYWAILNESERAIVVDEYKAMTKKKRRQLFGHIEESYRVDHYVESAREFFAQAGADYIMENKIPSEQMEPLLKKVAKSFFNSIKKLVSRGEVDSVNRMRPLFEKILTGDRSTPLSEIAKKEPKSFKPDLQKMLELAPETEKKQVSKPLFTGTKLTKEVPAETPEPVGLTPETKSLFASAPEDSGKAQGYVPPIESPEASTLQKQILAAKDAFDEQERSNSTPPDPIDFPDEVMSVRNAVANSPILQNMSEYKDIGQAKVHFRDWFRNTLQVFGEDKAAADEILFVPFVKSKDENIDFLKKETDELAANVPFGKDSKESKHIQLYGEGKITWEELVDKFREKKASQIRDADKFFRKKYDEFYARLNGVEQHIYPTSPHKWTPYRKDYYRHFYEVSNEFSRLQNILENPIRIDPLLVGKTEDTKPKSKWASFKQRRTGTETKEDAIGGYLDYMNSVSYAIHIDPHIGRIREFTDILRRGTAKNKNLNKYIQSLDNMANELSGKTPLLDRAWMEHLPGGRAGLAGMSWLNRRVKANTILMNVKSALAQILNVPQGVATAGPINSARGAVKAMGGVFVKNEALAKSPFMKERFFKGFQQFDKGVLANTKKFAAWMVTALDEAGSVIIWNGQYEKARNNGEANPIKVADDATRNLVGGRGIGEKPTIQNSDVFQIVAPFQYEMTNIWWIMEDMAKGDDELKKKMGQFMMLWIYMWLTNEIFEKVTGGRPLFDPIEAVKDGIEEIKVENNAKGWTKAVGRQAGEVVSNLPGGQFLGTAYPVYGFDIGGVEFPTREEFMGSGDPTRFGEGLLSTKALSDPLFKVAPPYGGGQIKKIWQGLNTLDDQASFTKNGSFQYKVDDGFKNYLTAILFGKYALPEAKEYYEERDKQKSSSGGSNRFNGL